MIGRSSKTRSRSSKQHTTRPPVPSHVSTANDPERATSADSRVERAPGHSIRQSSYGTTRPTPFAPMNLAPESNRRFRSLGQDTSPRGGAEVVYPVRFPSPVGGCPGGKGLMSSGSPTPGEDIGRGNPSPHRRAVTRGGGGTWGGGSVLGRALSVRAFEPGRVGVLTHRLDDAD